MLLLFVLLSQRRMSAIDIIYIDEKAEKFHYTFCVVGFVSCLLVSLFRCNL